MNATAAKLLVAAGDLMIERNTTDVSLSEIAQKSGVNAALVKYHFGNKDGLLLALLARDAAAEIKNLAFVLDQPISPTEKMRRHIAGIINAYYRVPYLSRLIHLLLHQGSEATSREVHRFFIDPLFGFVRGLLEQGVAVHVSHDLALVTQLCDPITVLYGGEVMECGTAGQITREPLHPYTISLIRGLPRITRSPDERLPTIPGSAPSLTNRPAACVFAPRCGDNQQPACTPP